MLYLRFHYLAEPFTNSSGHCTDVRGDPLVMSCWTVLFTDLDHGWFPRLTLLILSVQESLRGFLNYTVNFNLCLLPILSLKFNIFIQNSYQNTVAAKKETFTCIIKPNNTYETEARNALY